MYIVYNMIILHYLLNEFKMLIFVL